MSGAASVNAYVISAIAVVGTLMGALVAGGLQFLTARRQLQWQRADAELRRLADLERWAHAAMEERQNTLWSERRLLYSKLLAAADAWIGANRDLAGTTLPKVDVSSKREAAAASLLVAAQLEASRDFVESLQEVELLGHRAVVRHAQDLHLC
jgi:hypothetical protein